MNAASHPITAPAEPDPIFALIEVHRTAYAVWSPLANAWSETIGGSPEWDAAEASQDEPAARETAAFDALLATRPTTAAGLLALTAYLPEAVRKVGLNANSTEQAALDTLRDSALQLGFVQASAPPASAFAHPDAALLALGMPFLAAWRDEGAADPVSTGERREVPACTPTFDEAHARCSALADRIAALPATTVEGLGVKALALACYSTDTGSPAGPMPEPDASSTASDDALLWQIQAGAARILAGDTGTGEAPASEDAEALALVDAIEREWHASSHILAADGDADAATVDAAFGRRSNLLKAAACLPATSRAARHAKALALGWITSADLMETGKPRAAYATDGRLAFDLMDSFAGVVPPATADAPRPAATAPSVLDLSGCSLPQLARLYEVFQAAHDHLLALGQLPCFLAGNHAFNPAGEILESETDRLGAMVDDCVGEIARRNPAPGHERDDALRARVVHELRCNGGIYDPALLRDLAQTWGLVSHPVTEAGR